MTSPKKFLASFASLAAVLSASIFSPTLVAQDSKPEGETIVLDELATVGWIEKSKVAALREGVIDTIELQIGMPVKKHGRIGTLHAELAELSVAKAEVAARSEGPKAEAKAKQELSLTVVAVNDRLIKKQPGLVSYEEQRKAEAEVKVATAMLLQATEKTKLDEAELNLAKRALDEHQILAPYDGLIIERWKNPGERVGANEGVVLLGNLDRLRAYAYVPLEYAFRVKEGQVVEIQPKLVIPGKSAPLAIEQQRFRGKISFVDPEIQPIGERAIRIYADFDNKDHTLKPGLKAVMTIYLGSEGASPAPIEARNTAPKGVR